LTNSAGLRTIGVEEKATSITRRPFEMVARKGPDGVRRVLTERSWKQLESILSRVLSRRGAPAQLETREFLEAVLYLARTGIPGVTGVASATGTPYTSGSGAGRRGRWEAIWRELAGAGRQAARRIFVRQLGGAAYSTPPAAGRRTARSLPRGGVGTKVHLVAADERTALVRC
jgi:hypothetical protein